MIDLVRSLVLLLTRLLDRLEKREYDREQKERQNARDRAEDDPTGYIRDEFGGLSGSESERNAEPADQTDDHQRD